VVTRNTVYAPMPSPTLVGSETDTWTLPDPRMPSTGPTSSGCSWSLAAADATAELENSGADEEMDAAEDEDAG
jgi:hypothetical protein